MRNRRLRFGCHDFLNSRPLSCPLTRIEANPFQLLFETPARLASMLSNRELDLALIPSIEYARQDGLKIIRGFSISSSGAVGTVLLFSMEKIQKAKRVAVDSTSRTSVAMLRIILEERFDTSPEFITCEPRLEKMMEVADAALIIGDNAFKAVPSDMLVYDLGKEWYDLSSKPFVHAVLAVSPDVTLSPTELGLLENCFGFVSQNQDVFETIICDESKRLELDKAVVKEYLTERIIYSLNTDELDGLRHFFHLSEKYGLIRAVPEIRFHD